MPGAAQATASVLSLADEDQPEAIQAVEDPLIWASTSLSGSASRTSVPALERVRLRARLIR